jgi:hypothetical protein
VCCLVTTLLFLGPRAGIAIWWFLQPVRWSTTFDNFLWPVLGFLFLPWTTLGYVAVAPGGVIGGDWLLLALALVIDVAGYAGGYGSRSRVTQYAR